MTAVAQTSIRIDQPATAAEPVYVFGTSVLGKHMGDSVAHAMKFHGAQLGKWSGPTGNSYAIPCRSSELKLLAIEVIDNYIQSFLSYARQHPELTFVVTRFGCGDGQHHDATIAKLFRDAPRNCQLPGIWARLLAPTSPVRLLISDPAAHMKSKVWQTKLQTYLKRNAPLWKASSVDLVSAGLALSVVANDLAARNLHLKHCIVSCSTEYYRELAPFAAELKAVWYATHLLCISDFSRSAQPNQIRITTAAARAGLCVEHVDVRDSALDAN
ncbi:MAG: hypothetical protein EXR86_15255 [Gammaproteobacteria bacterium]|nr:hypothetical protein [Gammaproteobacteria bacterium]